PRSCSPADDRPTDSRPGHQGCMRAARRDVHRDCRCSLDGGPSVVIGKWFESYDEAWNYFLTRETPLEDFWPALPERAGSTVAAWLIEPPQHVKDAVHDLLARLGGLERVAVVPEHFLHISIHVVAHDPVPSSVR